MIARLMADLIKVVVDGQHGVDAANQGGIRHVQDPGTALVLLQGQTRDGQHGTRAARAIPGAPAGTLAVEISESHVHDEGIYVKVVEVEAMQRPPTEIEVPAQRDVLLSAVGGDGEDGHTGGDGQSGMAGTEGAAATRETDAMPGTDGGCGGDAGEGTNGADAGDGGQISVIVREEDVHLLLAVHWDVRGGNGGSPGRHGEPGRGGKGGAGGAAFTWTERLGYRYYCTTNCIGNVATPAPTNSALTRISGNIQGRNVAHLAASARAQAVEGGLLQAMIAQVATRYGARRNPVVNAGACECSGGTGHCVGCEAVPIDAPLTRHKGPDGREGQPGNKLMTPLVPGLPGQSGRVSIIVISSSDGSLAEYSSKFKLELLDFEVEDENGDGIFEPGEHVLIRRIRIRNAGGMPSPLCPIPITALASEWLHGVAGEEGRAYVPSSIPAGGTATTEGQIKVLIRRPDDDPLPGTEFLTRGTLRIQAIMPHLNRRLESFDWSRSIDIQYPIMIRKISFLPTLAQGSRSNLSWETYNKSVKALGRGALSLRQVEIDVSVASTSGALLSTTQEWEESVVNAIDIVPPRNSVSTKQMLRVANDAQSYQQITVSLKLYLSVPSVEPFENEDAAISIQLVEQHDLAIQVSPHYKYNQEADFLLITNPATDTKQVQAIRDFIKGNLNMELDEWNVGLYGGLSYALEQGETVPETVLNTYRGKTILFTGDKFQFFKSGTRKTSQLCDTHALAEACSQGTSYLFLGSLGDPGFEDLVKNITLPISQELASTAGQVVGSRSFQRKHELIKSFNQQKLLGSHSFAVYKLPLKSRWYRLGIASSKAELKRTARHLRKQLPQERFVVSVTEEAVTTGGDALDESDLGIEIPTRHRKAPKPVKSIIVQHGNPHNLTILATEPYKLDQVSVNTPGTASRSLQYHLSKYQRFAVVASLPAQKRVEIFWVDHTTNGTEGLGYSKFALNAIVHSLQMDIHREIQLVASRGGWPSSLPPATNNRDRGVFLKLHLPILAMFFENQHALTPDPLPKHIFGFLHKVEASCLPQTKFQAVRASVIPLSQRHSQLRKIIVDAINDLLQRKGIPVREIRQHHRYAKALHSRFGGNMRNMMVKVGSEFTEKSEHEFVEGCKTATALVPKTVYWKEEEWDARYRANQTAAQKMQVETEEARKTLQTMILEAAPPEAE